MNPQIVKIKIVFVDGSEAEWESNSSEVKPAIADFLSKKFLHIDGTNYNSNYVFSWKVKDAQK